MKKFVFLFLYLLFAIQLTSAQTLVFDMYAFGGKIGTMTITRTVESDGYEAYTVETNAKAKILWIEKTALSRYDVRYKNGKLISSSYSEKENGILKRWAKVNYNGKTYTTDSDKGSSTFTTAPDYSLCNIFFTDFKNRKKLFYEPEGVFLNVEYPAANTLYFKAPDGGKNYYYFENGAVKSMEFIVSIATIKCIRVK